MGVDISGLNPILKSPKPESPDWDSSTDDEKREYFEQLTQWQKENPGDYFRANWWSWRPIVFLIDYANNLFGLGINTKPFHYNDGKGLETQTECDKLANALEHILDSNDDLKEEDAVIYLCLGSWCKSDGTFMRPEETEELNKTYHEGKILYTKVISKSGDIVFPAHSVDIEYVREFVTFLRNCGGFAIY